MHVTQWTNHKLQENFAAGAKRGKTPVQLHWLIGLFLLSIGWNKRKSFIPQSNFRELCSIFNQNLSRC